MPRPVDRECQRFAEVTDVLISSAHASTLESAELVRSSRAAIERSLKLLRGRYDEWFGPDRAKPAE